jgi:hypothetical protein
MGGKQTFILGCGFAKTFWAMEFDVQTDGSRTFVGASSRLRRGARVKLYRINKLAKIGGAIVKKRDVLAASDREAMKIAAESPDCPVCDVLSEGQSVGKIT